MDNNNNSDYKKKRINVFDLLPEVNQSDVNKSLAENVFNRFLSKPETIEVNGLIGQRNPTALINRQIQEPTPNRQAFQLQPMMYTKIGTEQYMQTFNDSLNELNRLGVDINQRVPLWGNSVRFNWAPPIDIDKLINYSDYYWYDQTTSSSQPQYITIKNRCNLANSRINQYELDLSGIGYEFNLVSIDVMNHKITISGNYVQIFTNNFPFFIRESTNLTLNNRFFTAVSSTFDDNTMMTTIVVLESFASSLIVDGLISLYEYKDVLEFRRNTICTGSSGWGVGQWDDNQISGPIWTSVFIASTTPPTAVLYALWFDSNDDTLKQYNGSMWVTIWNNFSTIVNAATGNDLWDLSAGNTMTNNQWVQQNHWVHRNDVFNFSTAKQAKLPILEYSDSLELNEWNYTKQLWKYRASSFSKFTSTEKQPTLFELLVISNSTIANAFEIDVGLNQITFHSDFGNLSDIFVKDFVFKIKNSTNNDGAYSVKWAVYKEVTIGAKYQTVIGIQETLTSMTNDGNLVPAFTSMGDAWRSYNEHWLYVGQAPVAPVSHQPVNPLTAISYLAPTVQDISNNYDYTLSLYAESFFVKLAGITNFFLAPSLHEISLGGNNDIRVYLNGLQQYGNYIETLDGNGYITGVTFNSGVIKLHDTVLIETGPASLKEFGRNSVKVRTVEDDTAFTLGTLEMVSLIEYRKEAQVKILLNQYPLFDIHTVDGNPAYKANPIFAYQEDSSYPINTTLGKRIVTESSGKDFAFNQYLLEQDNGALFTYKDYKLVTHDYWFDELNSTVYHWDGVVWNPSILIDNTLVTPIVRDIDPPTSISDDNWNPWALLDGMIWFNTKTQILYKRDTTLSVWNSIPVYISKSDQSVQSIWKKGLNNEEYVPAYVDENRNPITVGSSFGDWEIPEQLYYNPLHENKKTVLYTQLLSHFNAIIEKQPTPIGFFGAPHDLFHVIENVNFGVGGTIHEYNDSYDTHLSTLFVDNVNPLELISFAQKQYDSLLNVISESFRKNAVSILTNMSLTYIQDLSKAATNYVLTQYEQNNVYNLIYGDSTTYNTTSNMGMINWIATLPYFNIIQKRIPSHNYDTKINLNEIVHHDGHRSAVGLLQTSIENIIQTTINTNDLRTGAGAKLGKQSNVTISNSGLPPVDVNTYLTQFGASQMQIGSYWYRIDGFTVPTKPSRNLYRLNIAFLSGIPPVGAQDGDYWLDTSTSPQPTLKIRNGMVWNVVTSVGDGIIYSAWEEIDIDYILAKIIFEVETRLYSYAPNLVDNGNIDFVQLQTAEPTVYEQYIKEEFINYTKEKNILYPYSIGNTYQLTNPFTWNYKHSVIVQYPSPSNSGTETGGAWQDLYEKLYGTPYPHLEPWKLQGYTDKPLWWVSAYETGAPAGRKWKYTHSTTTGMWENIRTGIIPVGELAPDLTIGTGMVGQVKTYNYFSVNIDDVNRGAYAPDSLLPPYWDFVPYYGSLYTGPVRSMFSSILNMIDTGVDFSYNDAGVEEWIWKNSSNYLYDTLKVAYRMQPVKTIHNILGVNFIEVAGLQIDYDTSKVYAHQNAIFHGELIDTNIPYLANGILQWYVNYNRYNSADISTSTFKPLWSSWTAPLTYQFASFLDTSTFYITNSIFDVTNQDFDIAIKKSIGIHDYWLDSLKVSVLGIPRSSVQYTTEDQWKLQIDTTSPIGNSIEYYDVHNYPFHVDTTTNICTLFKYDIIDLDASLGYFELNGDITDVFSAGDTFAIVNSVGNNGNWAISYVEYDSVYENTKLYVTTTIPNTFIGGQIIANSHSLPWNTGDLIYISTDGALPPKFNTFDGYYIIKLTYNTFQFAKSYVNSQTGTPMVFQNTGVGQLYVGQVVSTFNVLDQKYNSDTWRHYALNKNIKRSLLPLTSISGLQHTINIIDGYAEFLNDSGFIVNKDSVSVDEITGRVINWQFEEERFLDWAYSINKSQFLIRDTYPITTNLSNNSLVYVNSYPNWSLGKKVIFNVSNGTLPAPLLPNINYYLLPVSSTEFRVSETKNDAFASSYINLLTEGTGSMVVQEYVEPTNIQTHEINPFRNNIWFNNTVGIVSNLKTGPYNNIRTEQTVYDQYGRKIEFNKLFVHREDTLCHIIIDPAIPNDVEKTLYASLPDTYNYIHLGGAHLFVDGYEHVLMFNDYSTDGYLIYDSFVGLNTPKFNLEFQRQPEFTLRPNLGGYYLNNNSLNRNIEGSIYDMRNYYDTFRNSELQTTTTYARGLLGYDGSKDYMNQININPKSQFIFWRGMIQSKGSVNSINAFINSRQFIDAKVDEYWAYKVAEFGDSRDKQYPEIKMFVNDSFKDHINLEFLDTGDTADSTFEGIEMSDQTRWVDQPLQKNLLAKNHTMFFDAEVTELISSPSFVQYPVVTGDWYFVSTTIFDKIVFTWYNTSTKQTQTLVENTDYVKINSNIIKFNINPTLLNLPKIYLLNPAKSKLNPAEIIDYKSGVVVTKVPVWNPALGHHYYISDHIIDLKRETDPAQYTNSSVASLVTNHPWNSQESGIIWLDTSTLGYVPYYDEKIFNKVSDRTIKWGNIADWSSVHLYQWTTSDVPPDEWDALAIKQEGDNTIADNVKKTGRVRNTLLKNSGYPANGPWVVVSFKPEIFYGAFFSGSLSITNADNSETVDVYLNGSFKETLTVSGGIVTPTFSIGNADIIHVQRNEPSATDISNNKYKYEYIYSVTSIRDGSGNLVNSYHFWVENKTIKVKNSSVSLIEAALELVEIPIPYFIIQKFKVATAALPNRYSQCIIKGLTGIVKDDERFKLRYIRDFTLRNTLSDGGTSIDLKDTHQEWAIFRQSQLFNIPRELWDKVTEAIVGYTLSNSSIRVPSLEMELYDDIYHTQVRYGLEEGQAFGNGVMLLNTLISYLENPNNNFFPIDINNFLETYPIDTSENIITFMDAIYNTFSYTHVNAMFFETLMDALSQKLVYPGLFKTSMVSVHGIKLFESQGNLED